MDAAEKAIKAMRMALVALSGNDDFGDGLCLVTAQSRIDQHGMTEGEGFAEGKRYGVVHGVDYPDPIGRRCVWLE